ncbi:glutaredoxin [Lichtheimia ornata]|uniref:Glutaredoxin n=1 Tax=Lichtheimia ornata TaxID=688661 RepID=A0AAD7Y4J1_9FUNG|nr:glutaredoxin [Lichtheimia ornata]KAJ8663668.1 glutaredoxin [Lichtheimia ornata]
MSTSLPRTIQDLEAKERYAARHRSSWLHSRRMRVLCIVGILFMGTLALMLHFGDPTQVPGFKRLRNQDDGAAVAAMDAEDNNAVVAHDNVVKDETPSNMSPLALELTTIVAQHPLTVFSKTYCPYSRKAKEILDEYELENPYHVVEVDLRDDALDVKHALGEWTGRDTFPNVFLGGESIGGASELIKLHQSGELRRMLEDNDLFPY